MLTPEDLPQAAARARELTRGVAPPSAPGRVEPGTDPLHCPSAPSNRSGARVFAVAGEYLREPLDASPELLAMAAPAQPTQVFRFASPCEAGGCANFEGGRCALARRVVAMLPPLCEAPPACRLRPSCRWFAEQGSEVCRRCPGLVTEVVRATALERSVALGARGYLGLTVPLW